MVVNVKNHYRDAKLTGPANVAWQIGEGVGAPIVRLMDWSSSRKGLALAVETFDRHRTTINEWMQGDMEQHEAPTERDVPLPVPGAWPA